MQVPIPRAEGHPLDWKKDPIQLKVMFQKQFNLAAKKDYQGISPNIFVGRFGYPHVNVGFLSTQDIYQENDNIPLWVKNSFPIDKIISLRTNLINSTFKASIRSFNDRYLEIGREIAMAQKPVDMEISLAKKPIFSLSFNQEAAPHGPKIELKKAMLAENPKIPVHIEKVVSDSDLKAVEGIRYLTKKGFDEHSIIKLLTVGNLGLKKNRRLVPTRWGITAVDDTLGKGMIKDIKNLESISDYQLFLGSHLGNYYMILLCPSVWSYELFEMYVKSPRYSTDHESYFGRKQYAETTAGGYYTVRLAVLEYLSGIRMQATAFVLRFITDEYIAPLGVWVTREAVRNAMKNKVMDFQNIRDALRFINDAAKKRFSYDLSQQITNSIILKELRTQKRLSEF